MTLIRIFMSEGWFVSVCVCVCVCMCFIIRKEKVKLDLSLLNLFNLCCLLDFSRGEDISIYTVFDNLAFATKVLIYFKLSEVMKKCFDNFQLMIG